MGGKPRASGWLNLSDPKYQKTCAHCGATWNDRLANHECKSLLALVCRIKEHEYGDAPLDLTDHEAKRLASAILDIEQIAKDSNCSSPWCSNAEHILARHILNRITDG
jgi:hypothetical protein